MFIRYQTVRNVVIGSVVIVGAGVAYSAFSGKGVPKPRPNHLLNARTATHQPARNSAPRVNQATPSRAAGNPAREQVVAEQIPTQETFEPGDSKPAQRKPERRQPTTEERYTQAMAIALSRAGSGKGKDVLGPGSPWKLNLYDDNNDGQWDRGKLDTNRDDVDDEKWNFKNGRWEKDGGKTLWLNGKWVASNGAAISASSQTLFVDAELSRYRAAMQIATARADGSGKGKDVLGASSPWKLNLYDDDGDGQWDRGKLDTNRDDVDDEKWNFKKGRWEKDGGKTIWKDNRWQAADKQ